MVEHRLDNFAKRFALGFSRRRFFGGLAAFTVAGAVPRPAVLGKMRVNGGEEFPFVLYAVAAEPVGGGPETVRLLVGDAVHEDAESPALGFAYAAEGDLVAGDLQLLDVDMSQQVIQQTIPA